MRNCAFASCTDGEWKNKRREKDDCSTHGCKNGKGACVCPPPVRLNPFPPKSRDETARWRWTKFCVTFQKRRARDDNSQGLC